MRFKFSFKVRDATINLIYPIHQSLAHFLRFFFDSAAPNVFMYHASVWQNILKLQVCRRYSFSLSRHLQSVAFSAFIWLRSIFLFLALLCYNESTFAAKSRFYCFHWSRNLPLSKHDQCMTYMRGAVVSKEFAFIATSCFWIDQDTHFC